MFSATDTSTRQFVSLGMFIVDEFEFRDAEGNLTGKTLPGQVGSQASHPSIQLRGGTYAAIGARIWLPPQAVGMIIDRGYDFPPHIQAELDLYGPDMWLFRDDPGRGTTRALNSYKGEFRDFEYLTPRVRITPNDLANTKLARPRVLHFICSPTRASVILNEVKAQEAWHPTTVYEPIPYRCVPEQLPALQQCLPDVSILSPNAEEAMALLGMPTVEPTKELVEEACGRFLDMGIGPRGAGSVIIRCAHMGACIGTQDAPYTWIPAFWTPNDAHKVVDVTGGGNSFLGGLGAGLVLSDGDVKEAVLYAMVSASYIIEQEGLPRYTQVEDEGVVVEKWNDGSPQQRLQELQKRLVEEDTK
ncbi:Ribokinase-like protein [Epithele typhae]|uniref:Ribokinase-like protein n=1 Tax=Epithele typhae TaxID=378194 RepID=UPI002007AA7F|nr:Ribokinase-like protein [Epithele typhae]KAH9943109.1 Ribokinase-like protein [Epithele typhae]